MELIMLLLLNYYTLPNDSLLISNRYYNCASLATDAVMQNWNQNNILECRFLSKVESMDVDLKILELNKLCLRSNIWNLK